MTDYKETPAERVLRERCDGLERANAKLLARLEAVEAATGLFASDAELATSKGDPAIKFDPRGWRGKSFEGRRMSEAPPDYLERLANSLAHAADNPKPGKERYVPYNRADAARARAWARRKRENWKPEPTSELGATFQPPSFDPGAADFGTTFEAPSFETPNDKFADAPLEVDEGPL